MTPENDIKATVYEGIRTLLEKSFPKTCPACGRQFETLEQYLDETEAAPGDAADAKSGEDEDLVAMVRHCPCGAVMMDEFYNRRDDSYAGIQRRKVFDRVLLQLKSDGIPDDRARSILREHLKGASQEVQLRVKSRHDKS